MKPIKLKIKGLNSFIEMQEIDFLNLSKEGLFGIFGPTGSGKSTILDGITLALYGDVSRNSSNYINTNCDSMYVSYEFQITNKEIKRYRVDREFKRDQKTGSVRTKYAVITDITDGELILEDRIRNVTQKCEEIIGLKLDDFTRTVVLPQGKFSEFLKLEGKDRREMLERLFNLQKYGDVLSFKLGAKINEEKQNANMLEGSLKTFENINNELYKQKNEEFGKTKENLVVCRNELNEAEKAFDEGKELWNLLEELKVVVNKENSLKEKEEEINLNKLKVNSGESALKVKPYVDSYENTINEISAAQEKLIELNKEIEIIKGNKNIAETKLQEAKEKKDIEIPKLKVKEQQIEEAIEEKKAADILINEKKRIEEYILTIDKNINTVNKELLTNDENIINLNNEINSKEEKAEKLKISEDFKNKVNEGIVLLKECEGIKKQRDKLKKDIEINLKNINEAQNKSEDVSKLLNEKESEFIKTSKKLEQLIKNCPGDKDELLALNEKYSNIKDKWDKHNEYTSLIEKSKSNEEIFKNELQKNELDKVKLSEEIDVLKEEIKKAETENIAHTLRESLVEGELCPVCGSTHHYTENIPIIEIPYNIQDLSWELSHKEGNLSSLTEEIIKLNERLKTEGTIINENYLKLKGLGDEYIKYSAEELKLEFDKKNSDINKYNEEKTTIDEKIKILTEEKNNLLLEYNNINGNLNHYKKMLSNLREEFDLSNNEFNDANNKLLLLKEEISVEDFKKIKNEINEKENERDLLGKSIKILRENLGKGQKRKEELSEKYNNLKIELKGKKTIIEEKIKNIAEKHRSITNKAGDKENLHVFKDEIVNLIAVIEKDLVYAEKNKKETERQFNETSNKIISNQGKLLSLQKMSINDKDSLDKVLGEEGITIAEAKNNFIPKTEIDRLKTIIENYNNSLAELKGEKLSLNNKINNRSLTIEKWNEIQNNKNEKVKTLEGLQKTITAMEVELNSIADKLKIKDGLLKEKDKLDSKMALLNDLEKLFRGKKFIEFVAANQLKYVSIEASKKLKEISGGIYGLEVDENGKFIIRDYKNGGATRDASTLSGGETFLASLALALALSSQIQLKGTAPLELFFLDEGFGTLDDNLLDIVMDSVEKLHHDRLSIGIISHVESIKNRVPVKLLVTPAKAGLGGSKVKIEIN